MSSCLFQGDMMGLKNELQCERILSDKRTHIQSYSAKLVMTSQFDGPSI